MIPNRVLQQLLPVPEAVNRQLDENTGRLLNAEGGWTLTRQDLIYPLAVLYRQNASPFHGDDALLHTALRVGDCIRNEQDQDGMTEFIKEDGSRWGRIYMPWTLFHWLEAFALLKDGMSSAHCQRWKTGLTLALDGVAHEIDGSRVHNIPTWHAMTLTRACAVLDDRRWLSAAENFMHRVMGEQIDGYWPEWGGPTIGYNSVYFHALGMYYYFTGDESVLPALRKAMDFHQTFLYPDGTLIETIDGRVRYHDRVLIHGWSAIGLFPEGRTVLDMLLKRLQEKPLPLGNLPRIATVCDYFPTEEETAPVLQTSQSGHSIFNEKALIRKEGDWFYIVNGFVTPLENRPQNSRVRWSLTRGQQLSLWHKDYGLVIGGGNSRNQPEFATWQVFHDADQYLEPSDISLSADTAYDRQTLQYGSIKGITTVTRLDDGRDGWKIGFHIKSETVRPDDPLKAYISLPLMGLKGTEIVFDNKAVKVPDPESQLQWSWENLHTFTSTIIPEYGEGFSGDQKREEHTRTMRTGQLQFILPEDTVFQWPIYPFNPYAIDNRSPAEQAQGVLVFPLPPDESTKDVIVYIDEQCQ